MSDGTPKTKPKLLVILGAGSSRALGMPMIPGLNKQMRESAESWAEELAKQGDQQERTDYFKLVWANREAAAELKKREMWATPIRPNYERCLGDLHALMNGTLPNLGGTGHTKELCEVLGLGREDHNQSKWPLIQAIQSLLRVLLEDLAVGFRRSCSEFEKEVGTRWKVEFSQYRALFAALRERFDLGVYNLNHDTVALNAMNDFYTGFASPSPESGAQPWEVRSGKFEATKVQNRREWGFLYHLHGSVHFSLGRKDVADGPGQPSLDICWLDKLVYRTDPFRDVWAPEVKTDNRQLMQSTLVAGGWKLDQLQVEPFQTFYSTLPRHAHEADAILIAGYGFGDPHVNSVLANMLNSRKEARPPVVVLDFRSLESRPLDGTSRSEGIEPFGYEESGWHGDLWNALNLWGHPMQRVAGIAPETVGVTLRGEVKQEEYVICLDPGYPVAVWFGGFLAAVDREDEIVNWLLRHMPGRSEL